MSRIVQARLDPGMEKVLERLRRATGLTDSELLRRGLLALSQTQPTKGARHIRGVGRFASGSRDLGSNKSHLAGFGRS